MVWEWFEPSPDLCSSQRDALSASAKSSDMSCAGRAVHGRYENTVAKKIENTDTGEDTDTGEVSYCSMEDTKILIDPATMIPKKSRMMFKAGPARLLSLMGPEMGPICQSTVFHMHTGPEVDHCNKNILLQDQTHA